MKIILSPAKKMNTNHDTLEPMGLPMFIYRSSEILAWLKGKSKDELKELWKCNDKIVEQNVRRLENMDLYHKLTPAILSYEGIAYQYMAPTVFEDGYFEYIQQHLRILSAFYGFLKPMDEITPYSLEMKAKADMLYKGVRDEKGIIINLASKEYSKCIERYLYIYNILRIICRETGNKRCLCKNGTW